MNVIEILVAFSWAAFGISLIEYLKLRLDNAFLPYLIVIIGLWFLASMIPSTIPIKSKRNTEIIYLVVPTLGLLFVEFFLT